MRLEVSRGERFITAKEVVVSKVSLSTGSICNTGLFESAGDQNMCAEKARYEVFTVREPESFKINGKCKELFWIFQENSLLRAHERAAGVT